MAQCRRALAYEFPLTFNLGFRGGRCGLVALHFVGDGGYTVTPYYQDSAVTIYHGDCREIVPTLGRFDLLLTDPPYGLAMSGGTWGRKMDATYAEWDAEAVDVSAVVSVCDNAIVWGGNYFALPPSRCWLVWRKPHFPTMADCELAWTSMDANARLIEMSRSPDGKQGHPTQKPLALMTWCIGLAGDAQTILDPFAGSCTTGRAAKDLGRKCVCIEREEKYCEIGARRMSQEVFDLN
jgi:DNA modification methylase